MRNLVIDEGNTRIKAAWFEDGLIKNQESFDTESLNKLGFWKSLNADNILLSSVKRTRKEFYDLLGEEFSDIYFLDYNTPLPIKINYKTPQTLGNDRIAGVVAASSFYPNNPVLVIDAGTCITYDFLSKDNIFEGGGISLGVHLRFKALHNYTARLPLINDFPDKPHLIGTSTKDSMISGVLNGIKAEVKALIGDYSDKFPGLITLLTGGDAFLFETNSKSNIFAQPNLVLEGLNKILSYNASL